MKTGTRTGSSRFVMPLLALGGLVVAVAALVVPVPSFEPRDHDEQRVAPGPTVTAEQPPPPIEPGDWSSLAEGLLALRLPPPEPPATNTPPAAEVAVVEPDPIIPDPVRGPPLGWTYTGYIADTPMFALVVLVDRRQKLFYEGQVIPDPTTGGTVTIKSITPEQLIIERGGREETLPMTHAASGPAGLTEANAGLPGRFTPAGRRR